MVHPSCLQAERQYFSTMIQTLLLRTGRACSFVNSGSVCGLGRCTKAHRIYFTTFLTLRSRDLDQYGAELSPSECADSPEWCTFGFRRKPKAVHLGNPRWLSVSVENQKLLSDSAGYYGDSFAQRILKLVYQTSNELFSSKSTFTRRFANSEEFPSIFLPFRILRKINALADRGRCTPTFDFLHNDFRIMIHQTKWYSVCHPGGYCKLFSGALSVRIKRR